MRTISLALHISPMQMFSYHPHFTDEKTSPRELENLSQGILDLDLEPKSSLRFPTRN